jgi:predicted ATPase
MIARIEALNYRCLHDVSQELDRFHVLVGPNGSGKSTFLDVATLLGDFLKHGLDDAILIGHDMSRPGGRARRVEELFFQGQGNKFEVAVELTIPERLRHETGDGKYDRTRYEVAFGCADGTGELAILAENFWLACSTSVRRASPDPELFHIGTEPRASLLTGRAPRGWKKVVYKTETGNDYFEAERGKRWTQQFKIGPRRAALANVPEDEEKFPVALWARNLLRGGVQRIALNVAAMRRPCSPSIPPTFIPDGSNLPRVVQMLVNQDSERVNDWLEHVRTVLPVRQIEVQKLPPENFLYLRIHQEDGTPIPSWLLSDGTLRMFVLTLLAYLPSEDNVYLIEEPENGVHPMAVESIYDALSSVYSNQVLLATHAPLVLGKAAPQDILCFTRLESGAANVIRGDRHIQLRDWKGEVDLATLYAAGVLS